MEYRLAKNNGDTVAVPSLLLRHLACTDGNQLRVALAILRDGEVRRSALAQEFSQLLDDAELERILIYWTGAGLLVGERGSTPTPTPAKPAPKPPRLSSREVAAAALEDPQIPVLITESQNLLGSLLGEADSNLLVSLYLQDGLPVDLILTGIAHFVGKGKRSVRYIARVLLSWYGEGIRSCADLERHLALLALRERCETEVAEILDAPVSSFTTGERTLIARWYEEYGYGREMIEAACQRAGEKRSARYLNGMLKKWYAKGYRTPRDLEAEGPANIQEAGREITPERDLLLRNPDYTPTFRKRGGI